MGRNVSTLERNVRQVLVRNLGGPLFLSAAKKVLFASETRMRRSLPIEKYCRGDGIEIGAAASPSIVPFGSTVKYVDKYPLEVIADDPELAGMNPVRPDFVCSGDSLELIGDNSQDFVLAFSMLEHLQNPVAALEAFTRVTRPGGTLVMSVPDKRNYGPDKKRPVTEWDHFVRDYEEGPAWSLEAHLYESARLGKNMTEAEAEEFVRIKIATDSHTHFHVWTPESFLSFLLESRSYLSLPFEVLEFAQYEHEALAVLRVVT